FGTFLNSTKYGSTKYQVSKDMNFLTLYLVLPYLVLFRAHKKPERAFPAPVEIETRQADRTPLLGLCQAADPPIGLLVQNKNPRHRILLPHHLGRSPLVDHNRILILSQVERQAR